MVNAAVDAIVETSRVILGKNLYILHFAIFNVCLTLLCCVYLLSELWTLWSKLGLRDSHRHVDGKKCFRCGRTVVRYVNLYSLSTSILFFRIHVSDQETSEAGSGNEPVAGGMQVLGGLDMKSLKPARRS